MIIGDSQSRLQTINAVKDVDKRKPSTLLLRMYTDIAITENILRIP